MHFKEYERKGMGTGAGEGGRQTKRNRQTASAVLATSYGPNFHPWFHRSRSFVRSFLLDRTHAHTRHAHRRHEYLSR